MSKEKLPKIYFSPGYLIDQLELGIKPFDGENHAEMDSKTTIKHLNKMIGLKLLNPEELEKIKQIYNNYGYDGGFDF